MHRNLHRYHPGTDRSSRDKQVETSRRLPAADFATLTDLKFDFWTFEGPPVVAVRLRCGEDPRPSLGLGGSGSVHNGQAEHFCNYEVRDRLLQKSSWSDIEGAIGFRMTITGWCNISLRIMIPCWELDSIWQISGKICEICRHGATSRLIGALYNWQLPGIFICPHECLV